MTPHSAPAKEQPSYRSVVVARRSPASSAEGRMLLPAAFVLPLPVGSRRTSSCCSPGFRAWHEYKSRPRDGAKVEEGREGEKGYSASSWLRRGKPGENFGLEPEKIGFLSRRARRESPAQSVRDSSRRGGIFMVAVFIAYCLLPPSLPLPTTNQIRTPEMEFLAYSPPPPPRRNEKCPLSVIFTAPFGFAPPPRAIMSRPPLRRRRPPAAG